MIPPFDMRVYCFRLFRVRTLRSNLAVRKLKMSVGAKETHHQTQGEAAGWPSQKINGRSSVRAHSSIWNCISYSVSSQSDAFGLSGIGGRERARGVKRIDRLVTFGLAAMKE
jgi:hypothetical protein